MTLLYPAFLFALVAIGIPIAVHLFNFHRYKNVYFSNVRYLEELQQETRRQRNLRQWLVLAARILAIVFLVLAFCQPVVVRHNQVLHRGGSAVSIYIDNSFSMENTGSDGPLLEQAVQKAKEIAGAYKSDDQFQLLTNDMAGREFRWMNRDELMTQLDELKVSPASPSLSAVVKRQFDFLHGVTATDRQAYIVSDFQQSTADFASLPTDSLVSATMVPLAANTVNNLFIDSLSLSAPVFYVGNTVTAEVHLRNEGDSKVEKVPVRLFVGDRQRALASVDIDAYGTAVVPLRFTIDRTGILQGRIETTDYPITFDDTLFFALNVQQRIPMTVVNGGEENIFLQRLFADDSAVSYRSVKERNIDYSSLGENNFIVLNELKEISGGLAQTLHTYVEEGGTLLVVPSEESDVTSYNQALALFGAPRFSSWQKGVLKAVGVNTHQMLYRNVFNGQSDQMELPTLQGSFALQGGGGTVKESIITLNNGADYLCETPCGAGRLYLFSSPLRQEWTDFVQQALFVPTVYNMALYSGSVGVPYAILGEGRPLPLSHLYEADEVLHLSRVEGGVNLIPDLRRMGGKSYLIPHSEMTAAGHYLLGPTAADKLKNDKTGTSSASSQDMEGLAFNYSRQESVMQFLSRGEVAKALRDNHKSGYTTVRNANHSLEADIRATRDGHPLWRWCIILALTMLLGEILLIKMPVKEKRVSGHHQE